MPAKKIDSKYAVDLIRQCSQCGGSCMDGLSLCDVCKDGDRLKNVRRELAYADAMLVSHTELTGGQNALFADVRRLLTEVRDRALVSIAGRREPINVRNRV